MKEAKESGVSANVGKTAPLAKDGQVDQLAIAEERERREGEGREREGREIRKRRVQGKEEWERERESKLMKVPLHRVSSISVPVQITSATPTPNIIPYTHYTTHNIIIILDIT